MSHESGTCILCGQSAPWEAVLSRQLRDDESGRFSTVRCAVCGHVQLFPLPTPEEDREFYARDQQAKNVMGYVNLEYVHFEMARRKGHEDTARRLEWLKQHIPDAGAGKVLDFGCGYGFFLVHDLMQAGYDVVGLNISDEQVQMARSSLEGEFMHGTIDEAFVAEYAGQFACVTAFHVLEHLFDPVGMLALMRRLPQPGGCLLLEVPNLQDELIAQIPEYHKFYWQRAHLSYFDACRMELALRKAGITDFEIAGVQRYGLFNLIHWANERTPQLEAPNYAVQDPPLLRHVEHIYKTERERALTCDALIATARIP